MKEGSVSPTDAGDTGRLTTKDLTRFTLVVALAAIFIDASMGHVGKPGVTLPAIPNGHLRVVWDDYEGGPPESGKGARYLMGSVVLVSLLVAMVSLNKLNV